MLAFPNVIMLGAKSGADRPRVRLSDLTDSTQGPQGRDGGHMRCGEWDWAGFTPGLILKMGHGFAQCVKYKCFGNQSLDNHETAAQATELDMRDPDNDFCSLSPRDNTKKTKRMS